MVRCDECGCVAPSGERWLNAIVRDHEREGSAFAATFCPVCAHREFNRPAPPDDYV